MAFSIPMPACHVDAYMLSVRALARATIVVLPGRTCNLPLGLLSRDVTHKTIAISTLDMDIDIFNTMINTYIQQWARVGNVPRVASARTRAMPSASLTSCWYGYILIYIIK